MQTARRKRWMGRAFAVAALSAVAAMTACGGSTPSKPTTTTAKRAAPRATGGGPLSLVTAVDMIATERCAHEGSCGRLGPGRRFRDHEACQAEFVHEARTRLTTNVCETGLVEHTTLLECLDSMRASSCTTDLAVACEPASMCSP